MLQKPRQEIVWLKGLAFQITQKTHFLTSCADRFNLIYPSSNLSASTLDEATSAHLKVTELCLPKKTNLAGKKERLFLKEMGHEHNLQRLIAPKIGASFTGLQFTYMSKCAFCCHYINWYRVYSSQTLKLCRAHALGPFSFLHAVASETKRAIYFAIQWMVKQNASNASGAAETWHWKNLGFTSKLKETVHTKVTFHKA